MLTKPANYAIRIIDLRLIEIVGINFLEKISLSYFLIL